MTTILSANLGYPRIGEKREWKKAIEAFWQGDISEQSLKAQTKNLRLNNLKKQKEQGIDLIPTGDFSFYDHVLDTAVAFNIIPERFQHHDPTDLASYFAIARGETNAVAAEMTKWFNTNYHYIVPELSGTSPKLIENRALYYYQEAKEELDIDGKPVIVGPVTFVKLAKGYQEDELESWLNRLLPLYEQVLNELAAAGASWVQIDEPILGTNLSEKEIQLVEQVYQSIDNNVSGIQIILQTYFETVQHYQRITALPVKGIGLDFVHGDHLELIQKFGFPSDKVLGAGIINGRNVWRANLEEKYQFLQNIQQAANPETLIVQPSCSLLHVPVTKHLEEKLDTVVKDGLSFANEKLEELQILTTALQAGKQSVADAFKASQQAIAKLDQSEYRSQTPTIAKHKAKREISFAERKKLQQASLNLPLLPTTTIGSLPQTPQVKRTRTKWRKGEISDQAYEEFIGSETRRWIQIQEDLDLDVLVHGEFERNDMVEYFGEKLKGFAVTEFGWVQSYGSRCVKPPLLAGNVEWEKAITVKEIAYAQSLTDRPVKGMLTGPVTILNWSFVHEELPRFTVQDQIALALEKEVLALEEAGINIIQVDEPALREGLPLDRLKWPAYFDAAVNAFQLATATVKSETQIHTHMCYSEFGEIYEAIDGLDVDVISIETSRSHGEMVETFEKNDYKKDIGLGVYDIHSPRVPTLQELEVNIKRALETIDVEQFWINPDCGLKTRRETETIAALEKMVEAAKKIREQYTTIKQQ
ncbi:5-methyltetrahydropteroyltriglutamate--homocysteine S-methyltransferase [Gracilibacillus thailandensis]|uniref:5-methyltetrahydropteroyltriglutamate--homocysteine methyltransferase n=1 Tax=Gracilibacillus thailandensis TaxID=563735 RepID=A0A6N7R2C8_9BACI|nr:5-methyltetrahydropteroyltriglutamate--homocysteine S-methyltransferase [Gracilibacillus thailandensis]MRI64996.1 5-methyltetrahydropteroyltriglutamate--homocysteine S-methyltransferase [Gracilibacillus thailandensis]